MIYLTHKDEHVKSTSKVYEVHTNICTECKHKLADNNIATKTVSRENITFPNSKIITQKSSPKKQKEATEIMLFKDHQTPIASKERIGEKTSFSVTNENNFIPICKSENDLQIVNKMISPYKERSKFTSSTFTRRNTFVGDTSHWLKTADFESRLKKRNICIPNHIPVRMYVNNIESNRNKSI